MQISNDMMMRISQLLGNSCGWALTPADYKRVARVIKTVISRQALDEQDFFAELFMSEHLQQQLVDELVIPETYFFRYSQSFDHLRELAAQWLLKNKTGMLRVASIPSATGEESYSIAIILRDAGIPLERFSVDAVDLSAPLIERAKQGVYSRHCLRRHPLVEQSKYFDEVSGGLQVKAEIRARVNFMQGNVRALPSAFFQSKYPIVFCRNLLIYLTDDVRRVLFRQLKAMLTLDGELFVGSAEMSFFLQQGMQPVDVSQVFLLQFPSPGSTTNKQGKTKALSRLVKTGVMAKPAEPKSITIENKRQSLKAANRVQLLDVAKSVEKSNDDVLIEIRKLADCGDLTAAYRMSELLLKKDKSVSVFLLQGEILLAMERLPESIQAMKKVLYLEPDNENALSHLVLMCKRKGNLAEATRYQQSLNGSRG